MLFRIDLGLKPASGASELLNRRITTTLQDPGPFDGVRVLMTPSDDGTGGLVLATLELLQPRWRARLQSQQSRR